MHRYRKNLQKLKFSIQKKLTEIKVFEDKYLALRHYSSILDEVSDLLKDAKISAIEKSFRDNGYDDFNRPDNRLADSLDDSPSGASRPCSTSQQTWAQKKIPHSP